MNKKIIFIPFVISIIILGMIIIIIFAHNQKVIRKGGVVPDEETEIKIAETIWLPIYGEKIYDKMPFIAEYNEKNDCWFVSGTLPANRTGGVPEIKIRKSDCKIIYISHGK